MRWIRCFLMFLGRFCLGLVFLWAAIDKMVHFDAAQQLLASKGIAMPAVFVVGACIIEILGGLSLILGYRTRLGALVLALFLIPTTLITHNFWEADPAHSQLETLLFLKNLAIFGGLLYVLACGPKENSCCVKNENEIEH